LLYGSETWTIKASDARRITAAEMNYKRRTAGYIWTDYKTRIKLYNTLELPILLYGSETWIIKASDTRRKTTAEMKYKR